MQHPAPPAVARPSSQTLGACNANPKPHRDAASKPRFRSPGRSCQRAELLGLSAGCRGGRLLRSRRGQRANRTTFAVETARAWVNAGVCYVCAWGPNSPEIEDTFDYASFLPELGGPLSFTLMTTCHTDEPLEEALWFAFYNGKSPEEPEDGMCPVVVVADSAKLAAMCVAWIEDNIE